MTMPGPSGAELITKILACNASLPILVVSMHNEPQIAASAIMAGALGYLSKDCDPEMLMAAIRLVAAGGRYSPPGRGV